MKNKACKTKALLLSTLLLYLLSCAALAVCDKQYKGSSLVIYGIDSEGFTHEYLGYRFKIDHLLYGNDEGNVVVTGLLLDVEHPNGFVNQTRILNAYDDPSFNGVDLRARVLNTNGMDQTCMEGEYCTADIFFYNDSIGDVEGLLFLEPTIASRDAYNCVRSINIPVQNIDERRPLGSLSVNLARKTNGVCLTDEYLTYDIDSNVMQGSIVAEDFAMDVKTGGSITFKATATGFFPDCGAMCDGDEMHCTEYAFTIPNSCNPPALGEPDFSYWDLNTQYNTLNRPIKIDFKLENNGSLDAYNVVTKLTPQNNPVTVSPAENTANLIKKYRDYYYYMAFNLTVNSTANPLNFTIQNNWDDCYGYTGSRNIPLLIANPGPGPTNLKIKTFTITPVQIS